MRRIEESELILNPDGSVYHLHLLPEQIANDIIVVGDPGRVEKISQHFDHIELKVQNREICTHTGRIGNKRITAMSTGMGTDNIDIVFNELDALVNIDLKNRCAKDTHKSLNVIRLGTSGALQKDIAVDSSVVSTYAMGFDGLAHFYTEADQYLNKEIADAFIAHSNYPIEAAKPYVIKSSDKLIKMFDDKEVVKGITATASGFYGPQGRELRLKPKIKDLNENLESFSFKNHRICNFEMETSALYTLGKMLGHNTLTICAVIANRPTKQYSKDYKKTVNTLIKNLLEKMVSYEE